MEQKNYMKLVWLFGFIAFAAVSCWATSESLHLLLPSWPLVLCYIVVNGFFIIASLGTKMIVDSLNQNVFVENRGLKLFGGILLILFFWGICSMPTNTHTFFYRNTVNDQVTADVSSTQGYLNQILNNQKNEQAAQKQKETLRAKITALLGDLKAELDNPNNPGNGPKVKEILSKIAIELGAANIEPFSGPCNSRQERERAYTAYANKITILRENREKQIEESILRPSDVQMKKVKAVNNNLTILQKGIDEKQIDLNKAEHMEEACNRINQGYAEVKNCQDFVQFNSASDKEKYTAENPVTDSKRLLSVKDVWQDFFAGKYAGRGFVFWIIISILVDLAAFIFFDLAFKKEV